LFHTKARPRPQSAYAAYAVRTVMVDPDFRCSPVLRTGVFVLMAGCSMAAAAADDASTWLARMTSAVRTLDYQGSFIYERNGQVDALRLFHAGGTPERERLVTMTGPRSEVLRASDSLTYTQAGQPTMLVPNAASVRLLPLVPDLSRPSLANLYAMTMRGEDRVAGYRTQIVDVLPRDGYRYGYRVWIEDSTGLPLRSAVVDGAGRLLEQFMFVALDIGAKPKESDLVHGADAGVMTPQAETTLEGKPHWGVADLPPGFVFILAQRPMQAPTQIEHQIYTDGLACVSVYVEPRDTAVPSAPDALATRGALGVYSHDADAWRITAIGNVPATSLERIARSVRPAAKNGGS
jgi:sigma-E factor negative regulatory protein RseB